MKSRTDMPHYHVTAGIICNGNRVLIDRRKEDGRLGGLWEFPGGKQEAGETLEQCLIREIREELGIDVVVGDHYMSINHTYDDLAITLHVFVCQLKKGQPKPLQVAELRWVKLDELEHYTFPPADKEVLDLMSRRPPLSLD